MPHAACGVRGRPCGRSIGIASDAAATLHLQAQALDAAQDSTELQHMRRALREAGLDDATLKAEPLAGALFSAAMLSARPFTAITEVRRSAVMLA